MKRALITIHSQTPGRLHLRSGFRTGAVGLVPFAGYKKRRYVWRAYRQPDGALLNGGDESRAKALAVARQTLRTIRGWQAANLL